jgi:multidrug transporter EmrE-like cation transporter
MSQKYFIFATILSAFLDILSLVLIKNSFHVLNLQYSDILKIKNIFLLLSNISFVIGFIVFVISPILFFWALMHYDLSKVYPINLSAKIIFNVVLAYIFLNETINLKQILGLLFLLIGIFFIT